MDVKITKKWLWSLIKSVQRQSTENLMYILDLKNNVSSTVQELEDRRKKDTKVIMNYMLKNKTALKDLKIQFHDLLDRFEGVNQQFEDTIEAHRKYDDVCFNDLREHVLELEAWLGKLDSAPVTQKKSLEPSIILLDVLEKYPVGTLVRLHGYESEVNEILAWGSHTPYYNKFLVKNKINWFSPNDIIEVLNEDPHKDKEFNEKEKIIDFIGHFSESIGTNKSRRESLELLVQLIVDGRHLEKFVHGSKMRSFDEKTACQDRDESV